MNKKSFDILIPAFDEESILPDLLISLNESVNKLIEYFPEFTVRIIIADGGSKDNSENIALKYGVAFLKCQRTGRGYQISEAYNMSSGDFVIILHADHIVHVDAFVALCRKLKETPKLKWGILGHCYDQKSVKMSLVKVANYFRFKFRGIAFGDQGIFFSREIIDAKGGFPAQVFMEDVEVSLMLNEYPSIRLGNFLVSSTRRWEKQSYISYSLLTFSILQKYLKERNEGKDRKRAAESAKIRYRIN